MEAPRDAMIDYNILENILYCTDYSFLGTPRNAFAVITRQQTSLT